MPTKDEVRHSRINLIRNALLRLAMEDPNGSYTLKELSEKTGIPYGSMRSLIEDRDCWQVADWTKKAIQVREPNYNSVRCERWVDSVQADRRLLCRFLKIAYKDDFDILEIQ